MINMEKKPMNYIYEIFGRHIDSDRLTQLEYLSPKDNGLLITGGMDEEGLMVKGDRELIMECVIDLYNSIYEDNPELISQYDITTTPDNEDKEMHWLLVSESVQYKPNDNDEGSI